MARVIHVKGRLTGPKHVELMEPVSDVAEDVEVILQIRSNGEQSQSISEFLRNLPPGTRSKEEIDRQIEEERESWGTKR